MLSTVSSKAGFCRETAGATSNTISTNETQLRMVPPSVKNARYHDAEIYAPLGCVEVPREMKEDGCGKANRIHTIEDPAVTLNRAAPILHSQVTFDSRHHQA